MAASCVICKQPILQDIQTVGEKGHSSLISASRVRRDNLHLDLEEANKPYSVHRDCFKDYSRKLSLGSLKRKHTLDQSEACDKDSVPVLRSKSRCFDIKTDCLYCTGVICKETKKPKSRRRNSSCVETLSAIDSIVTCAKDRNDDWGNEVLFRIQAETNLVAAEAKYHHDCALRFRAGHRRNESSQKGRPPDIRRTEAFQKLCVFLENNDECQYSLKELAKIMNSFLEGDSGYETKYLKEKLKQHYGDQIMITNLKGRLENVVTFRDKGHQVVYEIWQRERKADIMTERERIIDMAVSIIRDEIQTQVYNCSEYPTMESTDDGRCLVPESLSRFLHGVIKSKGTRNITADRRCISIAHAIIFACRPRSFLSPILLSIAVYIHRRYESRELIDMLSYMGFCDDYKEVQRLYASILSTDVPTYNLDGFSQFVFDNADFNTATISGHNTFHTMGGIACVTPAGNPDSITLKRSTTDLPKAEVVRKFGKIPIMTYKKPAKIGLSSITLEPLKDVNYSLPSQQLALSLDYLWIRNFPVDTCPSWNGFMQTAVRGAKYEKTRIEILPFIHLDSSNPSTIYTALSFARRQCELHGIKTCFVTFDQPLYIKAAEIVAASTDLPDVVVRLGGFHLLMSYLGSIGYIMGGSGLDTLWETVYAAGTVIYMMTGHAYVRAVRAHILTSAALFSLLLPNNEDLIDESQRGKINSTLEQLLDGGCATDILLGDATIQTFMTTVANIIEDEKQKSPTGKLWISYLKQVSILKMFLYAERTGDWKLHLQCIRRMIPYFHSAGHLAYAKSARLYLQQMESLESKMSETEYKQFTEGGYFTVRKKDRLWSGNFTDQTIEQNLMRMFKSTGGMTRGRGITESTIAKWINAFPHCIPLCEAIEQFANIHTTSSEQHKDLRQSSQIQDHKDLATFLQWLNAHSPFRCSNQTSIVAISTGLVADASVNCDRAYEIGDAAATSIDGTVFSEVKLKRSDRVKTICGSINTVKIRGQSVVVNPTLLFNRITCVIKSSSDIEHFLSYELAPQPYSLFHEGLMRKTSKRVLGQLLKSKVEPQTEFPEKSIFVIDGGYLLHAVVWPPNSTYGEVCQAYVSFIQNHFGVDTLVVFDGYDSKNSTKIAEQQRRSSKAVCRELLFDEEMKTVTTQASFLANRANKSRLIRMIRRKFEHHRINTKQAEADADSLIATTGLTLARSESKPVVVIGTDTDLLVILVSQVTPGMSMYMCGNNPPIVYDIQAIQNAIGGMMNHLMTLHAITGCDTTSALFGQGKKKAFLVAQKESLDMLDVFESSQSSNDNISMAGEQFLLKLYGAQRVHTIDKYRFTCYNRSISRSSLASSFKLESLPPTSAAARQHSLRTYLTVQQWKGNMLNPKEWGWRHQDDVMVSVPTDKPLAPECLLKLVACGCKGHCGKACGCRKLGLHCTSMCSKCEGHTCTNILDVSSEDI